MHSPLHILPSMTPAPARSVELKSIEDCIGCASCEVEDIMQASKHRSCPRPQQAVGLDYNDIANLTAPRRTRGLRYHMANNSAMPLFLLVGISICNVVLGWNPSPSQLHLPLQPQLCSNLRPTSRIKTSPTRTPSQLHSSISLDTEQSNSPDLPIVDEIYQQLDILIQSLQDEKSNENNDGIISTQPIDILKSMLSQYASWCSSDRPSVQLRFKASATIDKAFRLVTNEAFSAPYQLNWVNLGVEALQLQLHTTNYSMEFSAINGEGSSARLIPLQRPYDAIPKGTWLKALRALTSNDINSSTRSIKSLSPTDEARWITPSNAAFGILKRLVKNRGIRTFYNKKGRATKAQQQKQSLDERDFNMVLHAYATLPHNSHMHAAHRVVALQERTEHAPPLSPVAFSILVKAYGQLKDVKNVEMTILHAQRNGIAPDIVMANTVLDAYVNCGMLDRAQKVFRMITSDIRRLNDRSDTATEGEEVQGFWPLLKPNARTYNTLLKGMAEEGDVKSAMSLSKEIQSRGLWDEITTNTLVKAAVTAHNFDMAETILTNHTTYQTSDRSRFDHPNVEAYTELLDGYAKDGQLENALRLMQVMQTRGVTPNEYTYTCMVGALAHNNKVRQARKMINYAAGLQPTEMGRKIVLTPTYNAFISGLLSDNRNYNVENTGQSSHAANIVEVLAVLQEMQDLNIHPNVVTVALVVDGLGKCNPPRCNEARELVNHLEFNRRANQNGNYNQAEKESGRGISISNNKIATALIGAYGRANELESAMDLFSRINPSPDVVAFNALLDAYCQNDQLKVALELFKKHANFKEWNEQEEAATMNAAFRISKDEKQRKQTYIKPDVVTYTTLISSLLQLNSREATKRVVSLYSEMKKKWWISPDTVIIDT